MRLFQKFLGAALIMRVFEDLAAGLPGIYAGELYPWRHPPGVPLASLTLAIGLWVAQTIAGFGFITGVKTHAARWIAVATVAFSLTQMYQNQRLLLLIALALMQSPKALRWQIILVYTFSFLHKMEAQFWNGDVIRAFAQLLLPHTEFFLRRWALEVAAAYAEVAAWLTLVAEVSLPAVLIKRPRVGFALVAILHASFAVVMPDVITFGLTMAALASLFLIKDSKEAEGAAE